VEAAAKRARNRVDERNGYMEEIALLEEAVRRGSLLPDIAARRILELKRKVNPMLDDLIQTFDNAAQQMGDGLVEAITRWEFSWRGFGDFMKQMANQIIKEMMRIVTYQMIMKPLLYGSSGGGGFAGWLSSLWGNGASGNSLGGGLAGASGGSTAGPFGAGGLGGATGSYGIAPAGGMLPSFNPGVAPAVGFSGKTEVNISIQSDGKQDTQVTSDLGAAVANDVKNSVDERITFHLRPGGAIDRMIKGTA
jgi:hypothetical protein